VPVQCHLLAVMRNIVQDAICERLKSRQYIDGTEVIREGPPCRACSSSSGGPWRVCARREGPRFYERVILQKGTSLVSEKVMINVIHRLLVQTFGLVNGKWQMANGSSATHLLLEDQVFLPAQFPSYIRRH